MKQPRSRSADVNGRPIAVWASLVAIAGVVTLCGIVGSRDAVRNEITRKIELSLNHVTSVRFENTPLIEVLDTLSKRHSIEIKVDDGALEDAGISLHEPINLIVAGPSLKSVLRLVLDPLELTYLVESNSLLVTTRDIGFAKLRTVRYPIQDFASQPRAVNDLINLLGDVGYGITDPGTIRYSAVSKSLVANQSDAAHEEIKTILQRLRHPLKAGELIDQLADTPIGVRIQTALDAPTSVDFNNTPLDTAIGQLAKQHRIPILIDCQALSDAGIEMDEPITIRLMDISLRKLLKLMLDPLNVTYIVRSETIGLLTKDVENDPHNYKVCAYDVGDIVNCEAPVSYNPGLTVSGPAAESERRWADEVPAALSLIHLMETAPAGWARYVEGQPGSFYYFSPTKSIVLLAPPTDQRLVARLFANLRNARPGDPVDMFAPIGAESKTLAKLSQALGQPVNTTIDDAPLSEAMLAISEQFGLNIVVDTMALEEARSPEDPRMNGKLVGGTLGSALRELLGSVDPDYRIENEVVRVIPVPVSMARLHSLKGIDIESARLYCDAGLVKGVEAFSYQRGLLGLFEQDESQYWKRYWERWSEPDLLVFWPNNSLFFRHTNSCQLEISELLACLRERRARKSYTASRIYNWDVYPLPDCYQKSEAVAGLLKRLRKEIAASSWDLEYVQPIRCINGCLVINQTSEIHREIRKWLRTADQQSQTP